MNIATKTGGEVTVLHVIPIPILYDPILAGASPLGFDPAVFSEIEKDAEGRFEKMEADLPSSTVKTSIQIIQGTVISATKRLIETQKIDLVITYYHCNHILHLPQ